MPNKTIYVSEDDVSLFEKAKEIAGVALSSVITRALREYVARNQKNAKGVKEVSVLVGTHAAEHEKRFMGRSVGDWKGFSDDKQWWMSATIYRTQKNIWAIHLVTVCKATLLTDKKSWKKSGDYLIDSHKGELFIGSDTKEFKTKLPKDLFTTFTNLLEKDETPVEYLDI